MPLRGGEEREMISRVVDGGAHYDSREPQKVHREVRARNQRPRCHRQQIDNVVLQRMTIDGGHTHRGRPFMMGLVDCLVERRVMEQPG